MKIERIKDNCKLGLTSKSILNVKEMGNITELRYMIKNNGGIIRKIDKDHYYDVRTGEVKKYKHSNNRKSNKESVSRSLRNLRDIINTNITNYKNVLWITLTYKENMTDTKRLYDDFRKFNMRLKKHLKNNNQPLYEYITTAEPQARGAWHLHLLLIFKKRPPFIKKRVLEKIWGLGFVSINTLKNIDNVGVYLTAYLSNLDISDIIDTDGKNKSIIKGLRLKMYPTGFRIYRCSRGIKKPIKYSATEEEMQKKLKNNVLTFEKTIQLTSDDGKVVNRINYRHYNSKKNK